MKRRTAIIVQALVFVMFSVLAVQSLRGISVLNDRVTRLNNYSIYNEERVNVVADGVTTVANRLLVFAQRTDQTLVGLIKQAADMRRDSETLRRTLHNETSLVFPSLIKRTMPSVVGITNSRNPVGRVNGSGFVIDAANGYIMTAKHVVSHNFSPDIKYQIELTCGDRITVKRIFKYIKDDLAILVVDTLDPNYCLVSELQISNPPNSASQLQRGDIVIALGHPFSILFSASAGIISNPNAEHIRHPNRDRTKRIQLDIMLNPGNSGCAVLNTKGDVIGVWVTGQWVVRQSAGVCFAVPVKTINDCITRFNEWLDATNE